MEAIIYECDKKKLNSLKKISLRAFIFMIAAFAFSMLSQNVPGIIISSIMVIFFGTPTIYAYFGQYRMPYIKISDEGLESTGTYNQCIPWSDIESIHLKKFKSVFLIIIIKDNSKYLKEMSFINRFLVKLMMKKIDGAIFSQTLELFNEDPNNILSSSCKQPNHN